MTQQRADRSYDHSLSTNSGLHGTDLEYAVNLVSTICGLTGSPTYLSDLRASARRQGLIRAVQTHDTPAIFDWLVSAASYQGISDAVALGYMERNGRASWQHVQRVGGEHQSCPKLNSYWHFHGCGYKKGRGDCAETDHIQACCLPKVRLRNGNLNQLSYSLYFFIRDVANNDLVNWIDKRLTNEAKYQTIIDPGALGFAVIEPMRHIHGISDKILNLVLSTLLLGAGSRKPFWIETGSAMIAIDTLVHNFLARTGILGRANAGHLYGPQCYASGGCSDLLRVITSNIDSRKFNSEFPQSFPRFVQKAVWYYCAAEGANVCNGNRINDALRCGHVDCRLFVRCDRALVFEAKK